MPEISRFYGIVIYILYREHNPPHFHAIYGDYEVTVEINSGIIEGRMPKRALSLISDWYELHKEELKMIWLMACEKKPLNKIAPLD